MPSGCPDRTRKITVEMEMEERKQNIDERKQNVKRMQEMLELVRSTREINMLLIYRSSQASYLSII